jgi:RepB DNA-primase N-terminal domain
LPRTTEPAATSLLAVLFPAGCEGFIELRPIRPRAGGALKQEYFPASDHERVAKRAHALAEKADVYFGVAPRSREAGTRDAVEAAWAAWVDLDTPEAADKLKDFELEPSLVVSSGSSGHQHAYWALTAPVSPEAIERVNRALAQRLGGDAACADRAHVMRFPGTLNHKHEPPVETKLLSANERRYALGDLETALALDAEPQAGGPAHGADDSSASEAVTKVLELLDGVTETSNGWKALCPAHDDHTPSLSVAEGKDGRCVIRCFAGCPAKSVVEKLGLKMRDLMPPRRRRASSQLLALAERAGIEPFHSPEGEGHAAIVIDGHQETWPIRSAGFELWLRRLHYKAHAEALGDEAVSEAVATLAARAQFDGDERPVYRRVAPFGDGVAIDLGDAAWRAIEVTADGWEVVERSPVHFIRDRSTRELPEPIAGGSIEELRPFVNSASERSWHLLVGFTVMCFHPRGPYPIGYPTGEQGSSKSTLSKIIVSLTDPRQAPLIMGAPKVRDLATIAASVWVVGFDNVSRVPQELSDALCQLATGAGYRTRQLYTDAEPFILDLKRPVLLNGIGQVANRPDLLDRVALIELAPITPEKRRPEDEFWAAWEAARPRVLGALLDGVSSALANAGDVELEGHPRMADFARWGEAAGVAFGWGPGTLTAAIESGRDDLLEGSAEAHPVVGAVLALMDSRDEAWVGTATELLTTLSSGQWVSEKVAASRDWPKRADVLSNRLIEHAQLLRTQGIEVQRGREGGGKRQRFIRLTTNGDAGTPGDA